VDEGDGLENRCGRKVTEGSNPSPSANANRNACKKGHSALFVYVIWFAKATVFEGLIPVLVGCMNLKPETVKPETGLVPVLVGRTNLKPETVKPGTGLFPVLVLPFPVTLSLHPCVVQYLSPPVLARCRWNDPK
jgi:hypothetical protein